MSGGRKKFETADSADQGGSEELGQNFNLITDAIPDVPVFLLSNF